jgi:hypothetical protein
MMETGKIFEAMDLDSKMMGCYRLSRNEILKPYKECYILGYKDVEYNLFKINRGFGWTYRPQFPGRKIN